MEMQRFQIHAVGEDYNLLGARAEATGHSKSSWFRAVWGTGWRPTVGDVLAVPKYVPFEIGPDGAPRRKVIPRQGTRVSVSLPNETIDEFQHFAALRGLAHDVILRVMIHRAPDPPPAEPKDAHPHDIDCDRRIRLFAIMLTPLEHSQIVDRAQRDERKPSDWARAVLLRELRKPIA